MSPFLVVAGLAIVGGGAVAAAIAHAPSRKLVWMVAYLVLVVGVAQAFLGAGRMLLNTPLPGPRTRIIEWMLFNVGNVCVIAGTLLSSLLLVRAGTVLFVVSLVMFLYATRAARGGWLIHAYRVVLLLVGAGALIGLALSTLSALR